MTASPRLASFLAVFTVLSLLFGLVFFVAGHQIRNLLRERAVDDVVSGLETIEIASRELLLRHQYKNVETLLARWAERTPAVHRMRAEAPNGFVVAEHASKAETDLTRSVEFRVSHRDRALLNISATVDLGPTEAQARGVQTILLYLFPVALLTLGGVLWLTVLRTAIRPMERAQAQLVGHREQLEVAVAERTRDLATEVEKHQVSEESLRDQATFLQTLIDAIPAPVFFKDEGFIYRGMNKAFAEFIGRSPQETIDKGVFDIAPADLAEIYRKADQDLFDAGGRQVYETDVERADGERRDVIFHKAVFEKANGEKGGIIGVILDITESKATERALEQRSKKTGMVEPGVGAVRLRHLARSSGTVAHRHQLPRIAETAPRRRVGRIGPRIYRFRRRRCRADACLDQRSAGLFQAAPRGP